MKYYSEVFVVFCGQVIRREEKNLRKRMYTLRKRRTRMIETDIQLDRRIDPVGRKVRDQ